jgi:hypothetical protein
MQSRSPVASNKTLLNCQNSVTNKQPNVARKEIYSDFKLNPSILPLTLSTHFNLKTRSSTTLLSISNPNQCQIRVIDYVGISVFPRYQ